MEHTPHDIKHWATTAVRALLRRLARQAAKELQTEALRALAAAERCRRAL
jgi:hypothetical protein